MESHFNLKMIDIYMKRKTWERDECILWILWWAPFNILGKTIRNLLIEKILNRNNISNVKFGSNKIRNILEMHMEWHKCDGINCEVIGSNERDPIRKSMRELYVTQLETHPTKNILCKFFAENECKKESTCVYSHHPSMIWYDMKAHVDPWFDCMIEPLFGQNVTMNFAQANNFLRIQRSKCTNICDNGRQRIGCIRSGLGRIHNDQFVETSLLYSSLFMKSRTIREKYGISLKIPRETDQYECVIKLQYEDDKMLSDFINYILHTFGLNLSIDKKNKTGNDSNHDNRNQNVNYNSYDDSYDGYDNIDKKYDENFGDENEEIYMDCLLDDLMVFSWETIGIDSDDPIKKRCDELNITISENKNAKILCRSIKNMNCSRGGKCTFFHHPSKLWKLEKDNYHRLWETEYFMLWLLCHAPRNNMGLKFREKIIKNILSKRSNDFVGSKNIINLLHEYVKWKYMMEIKTLEKYDKMETKKIDVPYDQLSLSDKQTSSSSEYISMSNRQTSSDYKSLSDRETPEIIYESKMNYEKNEDEYQREINRIMKPWMDERISYMCNGMDNEIIFLESLIDVFDKIIKTIDDKILG